MPYCDDTPMEIIKEKFGISKAAFKRALGRLLRQGLIRQEEGWTILLENPENDDVRGEFAWAATMALNGMTLTGTSGYSYPFRYFLVFLILKNLKQGGDT